MAVLQKDTGVRIARLPEIETLHGNAKMADHESRKADMPTRQLDAARPKRLGWRVNCRAVETEEIN